MYKMGASLILIQLSFDGVTHYDRPNYILINKIK